MKCTYCGTEANHLGRDAFGLMHPGRGCEAGYARNIEFYQSLLSSADIEDGLKTAADCNELIDKMENEIPHDRLPERYDWLVAHRNALMWI